MWPDRRLIDLFKIEFPIVLAPMAGVMDADLVIAAARRDVPDPDDLADLEQRYRRFHRLAQGTVTVPAGDVDGGARTMLSSLQIVPTSA